MTARSQTRSRRNERKRAAKRLAKRESELLRRGIIPKRYGKALKDASRER